MHHFLIDGVDDDDGVEHDVEVSLGILTSPVIHFITLNQCPCTVAARKFEYTC